MKRDIKYNSDTAWVETITVDLSDKGRAQKFITSSTLAPFSTVTVTAITAGATGTSGNVTVVQSPFASGKPSNALASAITLALGADVNVFGSNSFEQEYITLDLSAATLGSVGELVLIVHAKR